jgi:hypothetical protein
MNSRERFAASASARGARVAAALAAVLLAAIASLAPLKATERPAALASVKDPPMRLGVASCAQSFCHGSTQPLTATRVLQHEYVTWLKFDPHSRAFATLRSAASQRMAERLRLGPAHEAPACLACHADTTAKAAHGPRFRVDDGIGCETCHGSASPWIASHARDGSAATHADNLRLGLLALDRPDVRAGVCVRCHVGGREGFADHAMMAAGHPRLSFELDTFTELWRTAGGREHYRRDADYARAGKSAEVGIRVWLVGLVEVSLARLDLIAVHGQSKSVLPEFGVYNCFGCHRQMRVEGWSGAEQDGLTPGALRFDDSSLRMLISALQGAKRPIAAQLRTATLDWQRSANDLTRRPTTTAALRRLLEASRAQVAQLDLSATQASAIFDALLASARRGEHPDYAAAEQVAMGLVLAREQLPAADRSRRSQFDALFKALEDDSRFDASLFRSSLGDPKRDAP